jgi:diacylglycerol kinase
MLSGEPRATRGWVARRLASFPYAMRGVARLLREPNARIHLVATLAVVGAAGYLHLAPLEWAALVFAILLVFTAEAFNTAIESLADAAVPEQHPLVGTAKDLAAGGVLLAALGAVVIGCLVFGPHLLDLRANSR